MTSSHTLPGHQSTKGKWSENKAGVKTSKSHAINRAGEKVRATTNIGPFIIYCALVYLVTFIILFMTNLMRSNRDRDLGETLPKGSAMAVSNVYVVQLERIGGYTCKLIKFCYILQYCLFL